MRLNDWRALVLHGALVLTAAAGISWSRPLLTADFARAKQLHDTHVLPSPAVTRALSLGYRSALADLIFSHVLVQYGQHIQQRRRFELAAFYLDVITTLDPKFREPYRIADTLITLQTEVPRHEDYLAARRLLDRGLREYPYDAELWLVAGQYLAYLGGRNVSPAEAPEWQQEGARKLARACELQSGAGESSLCLSAASLFSRAGNRAAAKSFLERVMNIADSPELQAMAASYLQRNGGATERDRLDDRARRLRKLWSEDLPFVSKEALLLLGPAFDPAKCAGIPAPTDVTCSTSFRDWAAREPQE